MTIRRILEYLLVLACLLIAGCSSPDDSSANSRANSNGLKTNSGQTSQSFNINGQTQGQFGEASRHVVSAQRMLKDPDKAPAFRLLKEVDLALHNLGKDDQGFEGCDSCPADWKSAKDALDHVKTALRDATELDDNLRLTVQRDLNAASRSIESINNAIASASPATPTVSGAATSSDTASGEGVWSWVVLAGEILGVVVAVVLVLGGLVILRRRSSAKLDAHLNEALEAHLGSIRKQQKDLGEKLFALESAHSEKNARLDAIQSEVRSIGRLVRDAALDAGNRSTSAPSSYTRTDQPAPKEEPVFPISATEYLGKMRRNATGVRPDFQNGILVSDPDDKGELVLIRDSSIPDETQPLFVVPRASQFQTKQDFYTYYEKYYDCTRPGAGEVWIVDPAVVSKVPGGWQLREKGVLEVR